MSAVMNAKTRRLLINVGGLGLGLLWVFHDEPKILQKWFGSSELQNSDGGLNSGSDVVASQAECFGSDALKEWNEAIEPTKNWVVGEKEAFRLQETYLGVASGQTYVGNDQIQNEVRSSSLPPIKATW